MHFSGLRIMLHDTTGGDFQESIYKNLAAMGLLVPDENEPFFKRSHVESNVIFVNPHAVTGRLHFDQLEPGWVAAIVELLDQGYEVVLNQGQPNKTDQANTRRIMEAVKVLRPHTQLFHAQRFADIGALKEFISRSRGMLTVESGMSHLGRACGTPTVVIKTPSTGRYWVPKDRRGFRSISYNAFLQQPQTALSDLRELLSADQVNVNPISRIASFAKESSQPAIRLLDSAV
jgi:ADP-heptose:LPS heptosyltransferase